MSASYATGEKQALPVPGANGGGSEYAFTTKIIGSTVAKRGIESAGGRLWFETVVGEGTTFFIELPLAG